MDNIRVGLIGFGYWGPNLLRNFASHPQVDMVWVSDLVASNLEKVKKNYPAIQVTKQYQEILDDPTIDAVLLAVPTPFHYEIAADALRAKKHVFIEKPMTATSEQARKLITLSKRVKRVVCVDHPFVFSGAVQRMKKLVDHGDVGKLFYYDSLRLNMGLIQKDINVIADLAPHDFSILDFLLDGEKPATVHATGSCHVGAIQEELAHIHLGYKSGFVADMTLSWLSPLKVRQIMLVGESSMLCFDDTQPSEKLRVYDKGVSIKQSAITPFAPLYRSGDILIPKIDQTETLSVVADSFVKTILEGKKPLNDASNGLRVVELIERTQASLKENHGHKHHTR